jgi:cell division protein FtsL
MGSTMNLTIFWMSLFTSSIASFIVCLGTDTLTVPKIIFCLIFNILGSALGAIVVEYLTRNSK